MTAPAGWSHSDRSYRWEYRARAGGPVVAFVADIRLCELDWDDARTRYAEAAGGVPLPDAARPTRAQLLDYAATYWEDPRPPSS